MLVLKKMGDAGQRFILQGGYLNLKSVPIFFLPPQWMQSGCIGHKKTRKANS